MIRNLLILVLIGSFSALQGQTHQNYYTIINKISKERIRKDVTKLVEFGTRHTLSDTLSESRGIGAARRWIKQEFEKISTACGDCLRVQYQKNFTPSHSQRIPKPVWINNVVAVLPGTKYPNRYVIISGDIDSRISDVNNYTDDSPGANDNATGVAATLETARVLSQYEFENSIVFAALSGEEQGLYGGKGLAKYAQDQGWEIIGVLNNDMIGNTQGIDGVVDNRSFRIFSEPTPPTETEKERTKRRFYGGEVDGNSRQLARYIHKNVQTYMPEMNPMMIYRLDRFGRGGHHRPFNDLGFAGVRIMEAHENYNRQHQDLRTEDGIRYGDVLEGVDFDYAQKLTAVNAINLAALAWSPPMVKNLSIGGGVQPSTLLRWESIPDPEVEGYTIYWRETTSPTWDIKKYVGRVTAVQLDGIVVDNFFFGVATRYKNGTESPVVFPSAVFWE
ncbi:MAG: M28 family peptidase [Flavobacteriaceae bacterium]